MKLSILVLLAVLFANPAFSAPIVDIVEGEAVHFVEGFESFFQDAPDKPATVDGVSKWVNVPKDAKWVTKGKENVDFDKLQGKIVVVEFWATWCPPCVRSIPHLNKVYEKHKDDLALITFTKESSRQSKAYIEKFLKAYKVKYPVGILEKSSQTLRNYGLKYYPFAVIYDQKHNLAWEGPATSPKFDETIEELLKNN